VKGFKMQTETGRLFGDIKENRIKAIVLVVLVLFSMLTGAAILQDGLINIFKNQLLTYGGIQVLIDLVIACVLILIWMRSDAKKNNRAFWPWAILTLAIGSFGPLLYLLFSRKNSFKS
jgi:cytochrome bd-type quinol oxidase subunit 2